MMEVLSHFLKGFGDCLVLGTTSFIVMKDVAECADGANKARAIVA
jgi:hypothetical protein